MTSNQPENNYFEQIDLDNRDRILTNEQIDFLLNKIFDNNILHKNAFGFEQNINSRLYNYCQLLSYYTDEAKLSIAISNLDNLFETHEFSNAIQNFQENISSELYSLVDFIKIKAIFISKRGEHIIFKRSFATSPEIDVPDFEYNLSNRIFTHNLPYVFNITSLQVDAKEADDILNLTEDEAIAYINKNIARLETLDHQHRMNISSEKIQFYKKLRKLIYNNRKLKTQVHIQRERIIPKEEKYKTQNLFKVGILFATGKMNNYFTINSKNEMVMKEGYSAPKIAKELDNTINHKYISASINNYTDSENGNKNIFNSFVMMNKIVDHCKAKDLVIDSYFMSRIPME